MKTIKNTLYLGAAALMIVSFAPKASADSSMHKSMDHNIEQQASIKKMPAMGSGIINNIDPESRKINLSHEAIPELKWPKMTMDMDIAEDIDLGALSPDDAVKFHIELGDDKIYRITKIMKSEISALKYLSPVEGKYICMVNNKRFDKVQIPTEVNGKTYYGCCSMCKAKLEQSQELREAKDPVSGNIVDKASAVIATGPDGLAYYFENEENMKKFDEDNSSETQSPDEVPHDNHKH